MERSDQHLRTPDGRYFVVRGRLWRLANPALEAGERDRLISDLMAARRALRGPRQPPATLDLRRRVNDLKRALGERGPVWWSDGAPDYNRKMVVNTPYADWYQLECAKVGTQPIR